MSYLVGGRHTWIDWFTRALDGMGIVDGHLPYFFRDLHAKVTADLGGVRRLSASGHANSESLTRPAGHAAISVSEAVLPLGEPSRMVCLAPS